MKTRSVGVTHFPQDHSCGAVERMDVEGTALFIEPEQRLVHLTFTEPDVVASEEAARRYTVRLEEWLAAEPGPFRVLVDCTQVSNTTPGWRSIFGQFFKRHREDAHMAWYNARPIIRITIRMFVLATGVRGGAFATEAEARAFLGLPPEAPAP